jgi:glycosyltransferase involved in cell wall biosynthesis
MPAISIVTISFNQLEYLKACLNSVRNQSFVDYEHVVVDPGSTDGSREWLALQTDLQLKVITETDTGPAQGLNHGIVATCGTIVAYLNADDEFAPGALATMVDLHTSLPDVDILTSNGWTIDQYGRPLKYVRTDRFSPLRYALSVGTVLQQSTSFKGRVFRDGLAFNESNRLNWDTELLFDAHARGLSIRRTPDCIGYFRLQPASITMSGAYEVRLAQERARLNAGVASKVSKPLLAILSFAARGFKKVKNLALDLFERPEFPGLVEAQGR